MAALLGSKEEQLNYEIKDILEFLNKLKKAKIYFTLSHDRYDAIMVNISVPGELWEVEFMDDGTLEIEVYLSDGTIHDSAKLEELFAKFSD